MQTWALRAFLFLRIGSGMIGGKPTAVDSQPSSEPGSNFGYLFFLKEDWLSPYRNFIRPNRPIRIFRVFTILTAARGGLSSPFRKPWRCCCCDSGFAEQRWGNGTLGWAITWCCRASAGGINEATKKPDCVWWFAQSLLGRSGEEKAENEKKNDWFLTYGRKTGRYKSKLDRMNVMRRKAAKGRKRSPN